MKNKHKDKFDKELILNLTKQGLTANQISNIVGIPKTTFRRMLILNNISINDGMIKKNDDFFDTIDSEIKAYLLGYFVADGCVNLEKKINGSFSYRLSLNVSIDDKEVIDMFNTYVFPNNNQYYNTYHKDGISRKPQIVLRCSSKHMVDTLINKYSIKPRKTYDNEFDMPDIPDEFKLDFIRGYFDGDGHISEQGVIQIVTSSNKFAQSIVNIIKEHCHTLTYRIREIQGKTCYYNILYINGGKHNNTTNAIGVLLYKGKEFFLSRKFVKFNIFNTELTDLITKGRSVV